LKKQPYRLLRHTLGALDDVNKLGEHRGAPNQEAIDVGTLEQGDAVGSLHTAAVHDAHALCHVGRHVGGHPLANIGMGLFSLRRGGHLAGANGPDGLIGNDDAVPVSLGETSGDGGQLGGTHSHRGAILTLGELLANASNDRETGGDGSGGLLANNLIGLAGIAKADAALRVASQGPLDVAVREHSGTGLASPRTVAVDTTVFGRNVDLGAERSLALVQEDGGNSNHNLRGKKKIFFQHK
jgi:hypothetical protein